MAWLIFLSDLRPGERFERGVYMEAAIASSQRAVGPSLELVTNRPCTHLAFEASFPNLYPRSHETALALSSPWCLCPELPSGSRHLSFLALHLSWRAVHMLEVLKQQEAWEHSGPPFK